MKVTIRQKFMDRYTKHLYRPGDLVDLPEKRINEIRAKLPNAIEAQQEEAKRPSELKKAAPKKAASKNAAPKKADETEKAK